MPFLNSFVSSSSSFNPALAWSLGNGGKGYFVIAFPFTLDSGWYQELPCTTFRTFQHRKEREGRIRHEFIVLKLSNGSVCRVERMGDPNARLNALATQGSIAQDLAQCFPSESEAHLESSEVISEVTLPCEFEIQDVLKICRAIKEGEKTRNYTLQVYNCYFFSLAIQACLTRFIAYWENGEHFTEWLLRANEAVEELTMTDQAFVSTGSSPHYHVLFRILSYLSLYNNQEPSLITRINANLRRLMACSSMIRQDLEYRVNNLLWYSTIGSSLDEFVEENVIEAVLNTLEKRFSEATTTSGSLEPNSQLPSILTCLVARAGGIEWPKSHVLALNKLKQKQICQLGAGLSILKEDIRLDSHTRAVPATGPLINWPWAIGLVRYLVAYLLWVLHFVLLSLSGMMLLEVSGTPTIAIEKWLDDMATKLEHSGAIKCTSSEWIIRDIHALLKDQRAIWDKSPWNSIYVFIKDYIHARANILEYLEESKPTIGVRFGDAKTELNIRVSSFQEHIIERIKTQAKEVESVWLGSSAKIQVELKETLSQVWRMIREDAGITEKVVQINHRLVQKLELLSVQDLEAQAASWRESLPNLESRVQELLDVASRPDAQLEATTEYARAKQELEHNKVLFAKAREILNDKQFQATRAQPVNVDGPSRQTVIPRNRTAFVHLMQMWFVQTGRNSDAIPQIGEKRLDLYQLHIEVENLGGPEKVQAAGIWRLVAVKMGYVTHEQIDSHLAQIAKVLADAYVALLIPFDNFCLDRTRAAGNGVQNNSIDMRLAQSDPDPEDAEFEEIVHGVQDELGIETLKMLRESSEGEEDDDGGGRFDVKAPEQALVQEALEVEMGALGGLLSRLSGMLPDGNEPSSNPMENFQRILAFLQTTLKDWLPDLNPQAKLLLAARMDVPEMQRQGWPAERITIIQRFRPALMQYQATFIRQQELQRLSQQGQQQQLAQAQAQAHQQQQQHAQQQQHTNDRRSSIGGGSLPPNMQAHNLEMAGGLKFPFSPDAISRARLVVEAIAREIDHSRQYQRREVPDAQRVQMNQSVIDAHPFTNEFERTVSLYFLLFNNHQQTQALMEQVDLLREQHRILQSGQQQYIMTFEEVQAAQNSLRLAIHQLKATYGARVKQHQESVANMRANENGGAGGSQFGQQP